MRKTLNKEWITASIYEMEQRFVAGVTALRGELHSSDAVLDTVYKIGSILTTLKATEQEQNVAQTVQTDSGKTA